MSNEDALVREAVDWAVAHGILMQDKLQDGLFTHAPMSLRATPFPESQYIRAISLAGPFNSLVEAISQDPEWLLETLAPVEASGQDEFTSRLMTLQREVMARGGGQQRIHLGLHRSDYMLHLKQNDDGGLEELGMMQVELNTISSSFGSLSAKITDMHKHLLSKDDGGLGGGGDNGGSSSSGSGDSDATAAAAAAVMLKKALQGGTIPENDSLRGMARGLCFAHKEYLKVRPKTAATATGGGRGSGPFCGDSNVRVLFVVQPGERNVMDQRALEYALLTESDSPRDFPSGRVRAIRATLAEVAASAASSPSNESSNDTGSTVLYFQGHEISVVYFRAGYTPTDYPSDAEWAGRSKLEHSFAIKCPCISYHLAGTKKVQQRLAEFGQLERFVEDEYERRLLRGVFAGLYSLDDLGTPGLNVEGERAVAAAVARPEGFVLKPQREGGGHNYFGAELKEALETWSPDKLSSHILMEKIEPPTAPNTLLRASAVAGRGDCVVELGVYGVFVGGTASPQLTSLSSSSPSGSLSASAAAAAAAGSSTGAAAGSSSGPAAATAGGAGQQPGGSGGVGAEGGGNGMWAGGVAVLGGGMRAGAAAAGAVAAAAVAGGQQQGQALAAAQPPPLQQQLNANPAAAAPAGGGGAGGGNGGGGGGEEEAGQSGQQQRHHQLALAPACRMLNESAGHLLRAKVHGTDEGGVAAGFACLSSPLLVSDLETAQLSTLHAPLLLSPSSPSSSSSAAAASSIPPPPAASTGSLPLKRQRTDLDPRAV